MSRGYFEIAEDDYKYLQKQRCFIGEHNNGIAPQCQQVAEKLLKSVLQQVSEDVSLLRTHKLERLNDHLESHGVDLDLNPGDLAYLTGMYFDARYPGENYIIVSDKALEACLQTVDVVRDAVLNWRENNRLSASSPSRLSMLFEQAKGDIQ